MALSIPFVGFLRMQLIFKDGRFYIRYDPHALSIPFVGFLRMQQRQGWGPWHEFNSYNCSQFPLWDFFECNLTEGLNVSEIVSRASSQFPLWDFFECNEDCVVAADVDVAYEDSQFPLWDFFECNR